MKYIGSVNTDKIELEVIECDCGFHIGLDSTYLDQVDDIVMNCPSCKAVIETKTIMEVNNEN